MSRDYVPANSKADLAAEPTELARSRVTPPHVVAVDYPWIGLHVALIAALERGHEGETSEIDPSAPNGRSGGTCDQMGDRHSWRRPVPQRRHHECVR